MQQKYKSLSEQYLSGIEQYLASCFTRDDQPQKQLFEAMRYSLLAGGKRLRPIFVYDFCKMSGGKWEDATCFAAAVEMIHTYSLIHDDLPCMDNDDYRRGRLTNHKVYGEAIAVLSGDALLTAAFGQISKAPLDAVCRIEAVRILSELAGELGMVGGQVLDMQSENRQCTKQEVLDIQTRKTGALIRASCLLGVLAGQGSKEQMAAAASFADNLGLAFQIRDDMLDIIGDSEELGKATGMDAGKNTFVQLYGLTECDKMVQRHTEQAISALSAFFDTDYMIWLSNELISRRK